MITSPVKAIGAWCLDCCGGSQIARKECGAPDCVLYPFRFGKNPYYSKSSAAPSEAQLAVRTAFAARARERSANKEETLE